MTTSDRLRTYYGPMHPSMQRSIGEPGGLDSGEMNRPGNQLSVAFVLDRTEERKCHDNTTEYHIAE